MTHCLLFFSSGGFPALDPYHKRLHAVVYAQRHDLPNGQGNGRLRLHPRLGTVVIHADLERVTLYLKIIVQNGPDHPHDRVGLPVTHGDSGGVAAAPDQLQFQVVNADFPFQRAAELCDHRQQLLYPG